MNFVEEFIDGYKKGIDIIRGIAYTILESWKKTCKHQQSSIRFKIM